MRVFPSPGDGARNHDDLHAIDGLRMVQHRGQTPILLAASGRHRLVGDEFPVRRQSTVSINGAGGSSDSRVNRRRVDARLRGAEAVAETEARARGESRDRCARCRRLRERPAGSTCSLWFPRSRSSVARRIASSTRPIRTLLLTSKHPATTPTSDVSHPRGRSGTESLSAASLPL